MGLSRDNAILNMMYRGMTTIADFNWDTMTTVPIYCLLTPQDVDSIRNLILSPRYSGNNKFKMEKIDEVMHYRGFKRFAGGTNRLVYTHPSAPNAVFKVAIDSVGINDNPAEFRNQNFLKPYCCKVFECSPCGTIASFEKVERITTFDEFYSIGEDYFQIIVNVILGKYVMDDIGIDFFMNFGIRAGCFPVILDFPYLFELDGRKLECNNVLDDGSICHGEIDYDAGFNKLVCKKCGRHFKARDLAKPPKEGGILLRKKGGRRMKLVITDLDGNIIETHDTTVERDHLSRHDPEVKTSKVQVVIETIPSEAAKEKSEMAGHETKKTPKVVVDNSQPTNNRPKNYKRDDRKIVSIIPGNSTKKTKEVNYSTQVVVTTVDTPKTSVKAPETTHQYTEAPKMVVEHKVEIEEPKEPVVGRVINVSVGKKPSNGDNIVKADTSTHSLKIEIDTVEPQKKVEAPKAIIDEPKKAKPVEEKEPEIVTINLNDKKHETVSEEKVEVSDDSKAVADEYQKMVEGTAPVMQQAVFFGDEPGGITEEDVKAEEEEQPEEEEVEASDTIVPVGTKIDLKCYLEIDDDDDENDHQYINRYYKNELKECPCVGDLVYVKHLDHHGDNESTEYYHMYICADADDETYEGLWHLIRTDDGEIPTPAEGFYHCNPINNESDEEANVESTEASEDDAAPTEEESSKEEEEDEGIYDDIVISGHKPTVDEIEDGTFWCVPRHSRVSDEAIHELVTSQDSTLIDKDLFITYFKVDDEVVPITYDDTVWVVDDNEDRIHDVNVFLSKNDINYEFCDELPEIDEAEDGKEYLLRLEKRGYFDHYRFDKLKEKYSFLGHDVELYDSEDDIPTEEESSEEEPKQEEEAKPAPKTDDADIDELVKAMKASSKKINPDDLLKG